MSGWKIDSPKYKITEALFKEIWESLEHIADIDKDGKITKAEWVRNKYTTAEVYSQSIACLAGRENILSCFDKLFRIQISVKKSLFSRCLVFFYFFHALFLYMSVCVHVCVCVRGEPGQI